ncbi:MAG: alkaline phosphatase family protein [Planctomycetota bacterium]|jgi:predicted AlkP superfamily phosphohydrolase/phosphomutase
MADNSKTVIIGLDGVPFGMIKEFAETGVMPHMAEVISKGTFKKMRSSVPEVSCVAWSSMITGQNPAEHGIFGFMDLRPDSYKMSFPNFTTLKSPPFWDEWPGQSVIINVPGTYPVRGMNGVHIAGFVALDLEKSVHPKSLVGDLKQMGYQLDVDALKGHSDMDAFLSDIDRTVSARIEAYRYLWDALDWRTFMLVFTCTDRLMHFLWSAYEDTSHKHHDFFLDHFRKIDAVIGEICNRMGEDDLLLMHSDHGFEKLDHEVHINYFLGSEGYLQFQKDAEISLDNICPATKAFALDPARIHLNLKGKYPCGSVEIGQAEGILTELEKLFASLEVDGRKVIRDVYRKEQIYSGPYLDDGPDLILVGNEGFDLKAKLKVDQLTGKGAFTGKHTQDSAFLLVKGLSDPAIVPEDPAVSDIKGIIEKSKKTA